MQLPISFDILGQSVPIHPIMEALGYLVGFQVYRSLRKKQTLDPYTAEQRIVLIIAAGVGAFLGSLMLGTLEMTPDLLTFDPVHQVTIGKTIVGGLIGGWIGVEALKKAFGFTQSSGDLFTLPLIVGIAIGRIGCWLQGITDGTFGIETDFFLGMDLGDGRLRHPTAFYEILFLIFTGSILYKIKTHLPRGGLFLLFMTVYMLWRVLIDCLKPGFAVASHLTAIQLAALFTALVASYRFYCLFKKESACPHENTSITS